MFFSCIKCHLCPVTWGMAVQQVNRTSCVADLHWPTTITRASSFHSGMLRMRVSAVSTPGFRESPPISQSIWLHGFDWSGEACLWRLRSARCCERDHLGGTRPSHSLAMRGSATGSMRESFVKLLRFGIVGLDFQCAARSLTCFTLPAELSEDCRAGIRNGWIAGSCRLSSG